ncbi:MAG: hypothetical protein ABWW66_03465 [Archaeoglobaceae archaeon]
MWRGEVEKLLEDLRSELEALRRLIKVIEDRYETDFAVSNFRRLGFSRREIESIKTFASAAKSSLQKIAKIFADAIENLEMLEN